MTNGYDFWIDGMLLPITPPSMKTTMGSNNQVVTLINEGEINILKSPKLMEISFTARFPMRSYPYTKSNRLSPSSFHGYFANFRKLKENRKPFQFIVARTTPKGTITWDTNLTMALEDFEVEEDAENGDDVLITFHLRQWKSYGSKTVKLRNDGKVSKAKNERLSKKDTKAKNDTDTYEVKTGDTLWAIAKKKYGDGALYTRILEANRTLIDNTAKNHGMQDSRNGHWIFPSTKLIIP